MTDDGDLSDDEVWGPGWGRDGELVPEGPDDGAPSLFDAPPGVEHAAAPAAPRPAPLLYLNQETGAVLVSLDEGRGWVLVDLDGRDKATCAQPLDAPPGGLEWALAELTLTSSWRRGP